MPALRRIVSLLDKELLIDAFNDVSHNGLQVENSGSIRRICCGVDACLDFFEAAADRKADLLVCHHGISWGDSLKTVADLNYRRLRFLIEHDMALYACHLPLDAHPRLGNNAGICRALGLKNRRRFGMYEGQEIGYEGTLPEPMTYRSFLALVRKMVSPQLQTMDFGPRTVRRIAVVSGGGADEIEEAGRKGIDAYLSGEPKLSAFSIAKEFGVHGVFAGHYSTEVFGVRAVAGFLKRRLRIPCEFLDFKVPF